MKKYFCFLVLLLLTAALLVSCRDGESPKTEQGDKRTAGARFLIATVSGGIEDQTAILISRELSEMGYASEIVRDTQKFPPTESFDSVIFVGVSKDTSLDMPSVTCSFRISDSTKQKKDELCPCLSPKSIARAAILLLPSAENFSIISQKDGAADVQSACDLFDMSSIDYTVETLGDRPLGDVIFASAKEGCDALILPFGALSGIGIDLSPYGAALITVGKGEAVRGALATFCIDSQKLAKAAAQKAVSAVEGTNQEMKAESFLTLCVSRSIAEELSADIEAAAEDFNIVMVD